MSKASLKQKQKQKTSVHETKIHFILYHGYRRLRDAK